MDNLINTLLLTYKGAYTYDSAMDMPVDKIKKALDFAAEYYKKINEN